ncbi:MarR family transcriptional regulator [Sphingorhabdus sp.]|jgi:DNA-binding MarR family transcriptional regulator|uniref:MarR family transcriptional regulator n=1 Tax=Sphingorhabdus sp. TaxID=1902408 RepID=UPI00378387AD
MGKQVEMGQLERIRIIEDDLRVRLITCEAEILLFLKDNRGRKIRDLCDASKYSHVTIHDYIRKLTEAGIIAKDAFDGDGRRVRYTLMEKADKVLDDLYGQIENVR